MRPVGNCKYKNSHSRPEKTPKAAGTLSFTKKQQMRAARSLEARGFFVVFLFR